MVQFMKEISITMLDMGKEHSCTGTVNFIVLVLITIEIL